MKIREVIFGTAVAVDPMNPRARATSEAGEIDYCEITGNLTITRGEKLLIVVPTPGTVMTVEIPCESIVKAPSAVAADIARQKPSR